MNKKSEERLKEFQDKFSRDKTAYSDTIASSDKYRDLYAGTKAIDSVTGKKSKDATSVRNIIAENIDSTINSSIPPPKVTPKRKEDEAKAASIENFLINETNRIDFEELNDLDERVTSTNGGDYFLIEWDNDKSTHSTVGSLCVTRQSPCFVIPQAGVKDPYKMDRVFIEVAKTKDQVKSKYGKDVSTEPSDQSDTDVVTQVICYYRDSKGIIGRFSWVNDVVLEDIPDYYARTLTECSKCGQLGDGKECKYCGSTSFTKRKEEMYTIYEDILNEDGSVKVPSRRVTYQPNEFGQQPEVEQFSEIPYYKPNFIPIVLRKNISLDDQLLGESDVARVKDQQNAIKKHETIIMEKLEKAGSFVTVPKGVKIDVSNSQMKLIQVTSPDQISMIQVINVQADVSRDLEYIEYNYDSARKILGITDSFQGRQDTTATSGTAKEFAASQTAGRLESKSIMKNAAYAKVYEMMFKLSLAFSDEPRKVVSKDKQGNAAYSYFDRNDFIEVDEAGELYWNDEFLFSTDTTAPLASNREAMWQETRLNFKEGTLGNPQELKTVVKFWTIMESLHYPKSAEIKVQLLEDLKEQQALMQQQAQQEQAGAEQQQLAVQQQLEQTSQTAEQQEQLIAQLEAKIQELNNTVVETDSEEKAIEKQKKMLELKTEEIKQQQMVNQMNQPTEVAAK